MPKQLSFADARPRRIAPLTVLPDAARVEERLLQLARARGLVAGKVAISLAELERELVREAQRAGACPALASPFAVQLALGEAARDHSRGPFFAIRREPGYARALGDVLAALTQGLLHPEELCALDVPERIHALERTLLAARGALARARLADGHLALRRAVDHLASGGKVPPLVADATELTFDAILDWTPLRVRLAAALAARVPVRIRLPWSADRPELTEALEPALRSLEKLPDPAPELELYDPADASPALAPFLRRLFAADGQPVDAPVALLSCATPGAQAREIARRCAALIAGGAAADSIAVAVRSVGGGVAEELAAALERAGVPWRERRGRPALQSPPAQLALSLLDLARQDFPREPVARLLSTRLLWLAEDGERLPPQALVRCLREAHVRDDATGGGYAAALGSLASRLQRKGAPAAHVEETARRVQRTLDAIRALPGEATVGAHAAALLQLLARWGLFRRVRSPETEDAGPALARASAAALARDQAAVRALEDVCAGLARAAAQLGDARVTRDEFARVLRDALAEASLASGGARGGAVQLLELRELPARAFEHLFVAGLVDGELPARPAADPLLSDDDRRAVNRAARRPVFRVGIAEGEASLLPPRQAEEPLLFQFALCSARASLTLLWPRADARGRESLRSPFADEVARAIRAAPVVLPLAPIPVPGQSASAAELLARAALDAFADPAYRVTAPGDAGEARSLAAGLLASPFGRRFRRVSRAAAAERERVLAFTREIEPGRFSGQLSAAGMAAVQPMFAFGPDRPLSSRQLEDHATCEFRTLAKRLLHIEVDDRDDAELGQRERGKLLHLCLERFFRRLQDAGRLPLHAGPEDLALLREVALEAMDAFAAEEHVGHPALWELKKAELLSDLAAVVEADAGASPLELERRFGFDEAESWPALRFGDVHVRGIVDRVDRRPDGTLVVLDYKSSRCESLAAKLKEETLLAPEFQLALYAELLRQRGAARVDAGYLSLKDARRTKTLRESGVDVDALPVAARVLERVQRMRDGRFEVRPLSCDYCDLKPACRLVALPTDPDENGGQVSRG